MLGTHKLILGDCKEVMEGFDSDSVDLICTSPPYWNQREYSHWPTYDEYMTDVETWIWQCARILKPGRHCFWVIPDKLPWPPRENGTRERLYMPVYSDTEGLAASYGLIPENPIVWDKRGPDLKRWPWPKRMWGSYPYPVSIIHTPFTERICVWRKPGHHGLTQEDRKGSELVLEEFNEWSRDIWSIAVETKRHHPAPFPLEIPRRILTLWSRKGDLVLDPFAGSATTGMACKELERVFVGIELNEDFYFSAVDRMATLDM